MLFHFLHPPEETDKITHLLEMGKSGRDGKERGTPGIIQKSFSHQNLVSAANNTGQL